MSAPERSASGARPHGHSDTDAVEEALAGGNASGAVVRVGDTVRKPWTASTARQVEFMETVRAAGIDCPRPMGRDEKGRLVLEFVPGRIAMDDAPLDEPTLCRVGALIRRIHDASPACPDADAWPVLLPAPHPELLCHNDLSTWNLVVDADRLVFIDWDGCGPSSRSWDLAWSAISFAHLVLDADPAACTTRLAALLDGYGAGVRLRREVLELLLPRAAAMRDLLRRARRDGVQPWARMHDEGHGAHWSATTDFIAGHQQEWLGRLG